MEKYVCSPDMMKVLGEVSDEAARLEVLREHSERACVCMQALAGIKNPEAFVQAAREHAALSAGDSHSKWVTARNKVREHLKGGAECTDELKPCPFCGGKALIWGSPMGGYIFGCDNIECFTSLNKSCTDTHDEAVDQWNTRTPTPAPSSEPDVQILTMKLSGGREEHWTRISCDGRTFDVRVYGSDYRNRAEYEKAELRHVLLDEPKPDLMAPQYMDKEVAPSEPEGAPETKHVWNGPTCETCNTPILDGLCECDLKHSEIVARLTNEEKAYRATVAALGIAVNGGETLSTGFIAHTRDMLREHHTLKATSDARIAELESATTWDHAEFAKRLAAARNEALEEVEPHLQAILKQLEVNRGYFDGDYSVTLDILQGHISDRIETIRALKTKEPTKPVKPDVVYNLAAMEFDPSSNALSAVDGARFWWAKTPEGGDYWSKQRRTPTQEGRDKIAAMREQFKRANG